MTGLRTSKTMFAAAALAAPLIVTWTRACGKTTSLSEQFSYPPMKTYQPPPTMQLIKRAPSLLETLAKAPAPPKPEPKVFPKRRRMVEPEQTGGEAIKLVASVGEPDPPLTVTEEVAAKVGQPNGECPLCDAGVPLTETPAAPKKKRVYKKKVQPTE